MLPEEENPASDQDSKKDLWNVCCGCCFSILMQGALQVSSAKLHVAGTPCTDYSLKGDQLGQAGKTWILFLCWVAQRLFLQEDVIIQENVPQFPVEVLHRFLGHIYHIETAVISPFDYGWGVQRHRRWTVCRHRYKTKHFLSLLGCGWKGLNSRHKKTTNRTHKSRRSAV